MIPIFHSLEYGKGPRHQWCFIDRDGNASIIGDDGSPIQFVKYDPVHERRVDYKMRGIFRPRCGSKCANQDVELNLETPYVKPKDPLILDLDGNGIRTFGGSFHFDHDCNGFNEVSGWIAPGEGILMIDMNGNSILDNGSELIGDYTLLPNGVRAGNGFQALAHYDANGDGKIDVDDPIWSQLRVWQYGEEYVIEPYINGKISSLDETGISAIHLDSEVTTRTDDAGNIEVRSGRFEWKDGRTGIVSEYILRRQPTDNMPTEYVDVPSEIAALPDLNGCGNVYDLRQAMARSSGLKSLVQQFVGAESVRSRGSLMDQILLAWVNVSDPPRPNRVDNYDIGKLIVLESFFARHLVTEVVIIRKDDQVLLREDAIARLDNAYNEIYDFFYADLMAQTHLKGLYDKIAYTWDEGKQEYKLDPSALISTIQESLNTNSEQGKELLSEFTRLCSVK
jgi:hypothetical protein